MIQPKNWETFQHYKHRRPPWIKLHRELLDNVQFARLPVASRALAPLLWLLASEYQDGKIDLSATDIAFRLRISESDFVSALTPLSERGFFLVQDASAMLAPCKQNVTTETETEKERDPAIAAFQDPEKDLFRRGKEVAGKQAGGLIARLLASKKGNVALARSAIETASTKENPREYLAATVMRSKSPDRMNGEMGIDFETTDWRDAIA